MGHDAAVVVARRSAVAVALLAVAACGAGVDDMRARDLAAAELAFVENVAAIHARDAERYLDGYLDAPDFVTLGPGGLVEGFAPFAANRRAADWPDTLVAGRPYLRWLGPGIVWGAYQYVAVQGGARAEGWSERVFVKTPDGWKIAVTGVIPSAGGTQ